MNSQLPVTAPPKRTRIIKCPICQQIGHFQKTCPQRVQAAAATTNGDIALPLAITRASKKRSRGPKTTAAVSPRILRQIPQNESGESGDELAADDDDASHHNVHGLPTPVVDAFAEALDGDGEADVVDTDSVLTEIPVWTQSVVHDEDRTLRSSIQQTNIPSFRGERSGPKNIPPWVKSEIDFFLLFMTDDILDQFVSSSNAYATSTKIRGWHPLSSQELLVFMGVVTYLGVVKVPTRRSAWKDGGIFSQSFLQRHMTAKRFEDILKALHWTNTAEMSEEEKSHKRRDSNYWLVDGFLSKLSINCRQHFFLGQHFDIDEMCIYFKGRFICKCYNPNKPEKWHLKFFALNDGATGYLYDFYPYQGAAERRPPQWGATAYPVYKLLHDRVELHNVNHILHIDNWYNQLQIAMFVRSIGMHSNGTVKTNRKGLPKQALFKNTGATKKERGTVELHSTTLSDGHEYFFTCWMDTKAVHMLSTYRPGVRPVLRNSTGSDGKYIKIRLTRPTNIGDYNGGMGGTDLFDQYCSYYRTMVRTKKWPTRIFTHFIMATIVNAFILFKFSHDDSTLIKYLEALIKQLAMFSFKQPPSHGMVAQCAIIVADDEEPTRRKEVWDKKRLDNTITHMPAHTSRSEGSRRECKVCCKLTAYSCQQCDVGLCIENPAKTSCYEVFHALDSYKNVL